MFESAHSFTQYAAEFGLCSSPHSKTSELKRVLIRVHWSLIDNLRLLVNLIRLLVDIMNYMVVFIKDFISYLVMTTIYYQVE